MAAALATAGEHRKALEEAERMEQEFLSLMTGQRMREEEREDRGELDVSIYVQETNVHENSRA